MTKQWRKLHFSIWDSSQVMRLPLQARILYFYMVTSADDFGRFKADAAILRKAFPYDDFIAEQIANWRLTIEKSGLIKTYEKEKELFAYHPKWKKYQGGRQPAVRPDKKTPKFPPPNNNQTTSGQQPDDNEMTQIRIEESRVEKSREEESRKEKNNKQVAKDKNLQLADKIKHHYEKEFQGFKSPPFSLVMKMAYEKDPQTAINAMVKMGEYLREGKTINDFPAYFRSLCSI